ncbi:hypothetical protein GCM10023169_29850 [Georgenia halophila]|uniref:AAA domain-containing protein n=1 Tax=Georgenia halophila TaxID=620889 RepID=A0ABP8LGX5_9MICO
MKGTGTISPGRAATTPTRPDQTVTAAPMNPTLGQARFAVPSGDPTVVISSPPGAGKTHLITHLAHQLTTRLNMRVAIAGQTRAQALDVGNHTAQTGAVTHLVTSDGKPPSGAHPDLRITTNRRLTSRDGASSPSPPGGSGSTRRPITPTSCSSTRPTNSPTPTSAAEAPWV